MGNIVSKYNPYLSKRKAVEEAVRDLSPGVRELAKEIIEENLREKLRPRITKNQSSK